KYLFLGMLLISIILIIIAPLFLKIWINDEYMLKSTGVFRILVVGYFLTSLSLVFLRFIYGIGIPKKAFILNLLLVPIYIALLVVLVNRFGIEGAAWAFMLKSFLDLIFLFKILNKKIKVFK
ncbi:polysaccharide biosynthesis C-terminal domain-containing protein, partial [Zhouia amylolytica]|uniref:polysaccharide biosynthesis C-terminal domain-containing protein n=1 Tax=Zhouia amylolytica TaxID=376730 RepID=UPI0020CEC6EA